jgi:hypothetical protein
MCRAADLNIVRGEQSILFLSWTVPSYVVTTMFYRFHYLAIRLARCVAGKSEAGRGRNAHPRIMMSRGKRKIRPGFAKGRTQNPAYNIFTTFTL